MVSTERLYRLGIAL